MKQVALYILVFFLPITLSAQNLIENGSFEEYYACPGGTYRHIDLAKGWFSIIEMGGSTDYYNVCSTNPDHLVPNGTAGFQYSFDGVAHGGFILIVEPPNGSNWREFVETKLKETLIDDTNYCLQYHLSLANKSMYAISKFGAVLSNDSLLYKDVYFDSVKLSIPNTQGIIADTLDWVTIQGEYRANGTENFITIGNFFLESPYNNFSIVNSGGWNWAYYYIDAISLYQCNAPVFIAESGPDRLLCKDDSVLTGLRHIESPYLPEYSFVWYPIDNIFDTIAITEQAWLSPDTTTTYILKQTDFKFDVTYDTVTITVVECGLPDQLSVYPSPAEEEITFDFHKPVTEEMHVVLYNSIGQKVEDWVISEQLNNYVSVQIGNLASGVYLYRVFGREEVLFSGKVIIW